MKKKKKNFLSSFERVMYRFCTIIIILLIVGIVCGQTTLAQVNLEVQKLNKEVNIQKNKNESLKMKINELASLENLESVAKKMGLSYTSNSIKTIDK